MHVEELKDKKEWETFLQASPEGTFYHSLKWREVIQNSFPHSAVYLTIRDANGTLVGICPGFILSSMHSKFYYSIPYSDYGGPVIAEHCIEHASLSLRSFLQGFCSNKDIAYAKICFMNDKLAQSFNSPLGYLDTSKGIMEISLKTIPLDFIWNKIFRKVQRKKIRRFERDGFQVQEAYTKSDLARFYNTYFSNMKHIGAQAYPYAFFQNIWSLLYPENFNILLVEKGKTVGGIAFFKYGRRIYLTYLGMDRKLLSSRYTLGLYLYWGSFKWAKENGFRYVCLGATPSDPKSKHYSQKMALGSSFYQQKMVWYPFSSIGRILLQTRAKTILAWKTIRNFLPIDFKNILESKLSRF